ncbi:acyltransferase [Bacillus sp. 31A1R]|uniref:Acyltransferase n=1 Tax=Robertmurraya mangrovi TaxID=3098077 RepID=A0ABU5J1K7_9BACI|nr:acyltransferase [Bacillus sp. 31A1R]MDZ5473310.1 acyltransferase [Bacillus sp. 31A1R]
MIRRYKELDSLRGIAAFSVFVFHILMVFPDSWREKITWNVLNLSPLHFFFTGKQHVILFFVLSGYVLSLVFFSRNKISYFPFILKRVIRLFIPYVVAITVAIFLCSMLSKGGIATLGNLLNTSWVEPLNKKIILEHYLFIGNYNIYAINVVIWTLIHEMRISFIIPILVLLSIRYGWKINLAIGAMLGMLGGGVHFFLQDPYQPIYKTLFYILMFMVGILLSKNSIILTSKYNALSQKNKFVLFLVGTILFIYADFIKLPLLTDWVTTLGVAILLIISISSTLVSKVLLWSPLQFMGKISYSLYLYHFPILLSLFYILHGAVPILIIAILSIILTIGISTLAWTVVENPSIKLGNYLSKKLINIQSQTIVDKQKLS